MADSQPSTQPGVPPGNVYHKERRGLRRGRTPRLESGAPLSRPDNNDNPARQTFIASIRRFVAVSVVMVAVLLLAIKGINMLETADEQIVVPQDDGSALAREVMPTEKPRVIVSATSSAPAEASGASTEDSMRQAAFLARRAKDLETSGQFQDAIGRYRESLNLWPYQPSVWSQLGRLYLRVGDLAKAQLALERAVADTPSATELQNDLGVIYFQEGNITAAIKMFSAYADIDPTSAPAFFNLSLCYLARGDAPRARSYIDRYLTLQPDDPRALRQAAFLDAATNNLAAAKVGLDRALAISPDWALLYLDSAALEARSTNVEVAISRLNRATELMSPLLVQRVYANNAFNNIRTMPSARLFEQNLSAKVAHTEASITGEAVTAESPGPISSLTAKP